MIESFTSFKKEDLQKWFNDKIELNINLIFYPNDNFIRLKALVDFVMLLELKNELGLTMNIDPKLFKTIYDFWPMARHIFTVSLSKKDLKRLHPVKGKN